MSKELKIYRKYASFVKRFLLLSGMCPITKERDVFYRCISIWSIFSSFISLCVVGNFCSQNVQNIALLTASFSLFCAILNTTTKVCKFIYIYFKRIHFIHIIELSLLTFKCVIRILPSNSTNPNPRQTKIFKIRDSFFVIET